MINTLVLSTIRKKNPSFAFDEKVNTGILFQLVLRKVIQRVRGFRFILSGNMPNKLFLGRNVRLSYVSNISFGKWVQLEDHVQISGLCKAKVTLGNNVKIGAYSQVIASTSFNNIGEYIRIGNNVGIGEFAYLGGGGGLEIGDDCIIGQYLSCHPENHNYDDPTQLIRLQGVSRQGIKIGANCWIGAKVTILDGVTIGANCVIAAGAVVTKNMPPNSVIAGVPAKVLKSRTIKNH